MSGRPTLWRRRRCGGRAGLGVVAVAGLALLAVPQPAAADVVRLTSEQGAGAPDIAVDAAGTAHVAWAQTVASGPDTVGYCRVPRGAQACDLTHRFAPASFGDGEAKSVRVVVSPAGEVIVAPSTQGRVDIVTSVDGGATFSTPRTISDALIGAAEPEVEFGPGDFSLSLADCFPDVTYQAAPLNSMTSEAAVLGPGCPATGEDFDISIGFVDPLTPLVAYNDPDSGQMFFRRWSAGNYNQAPNWAPQKAIGPGDKTRLASGPRGAFLAYEGETSPSETGIVVRRFDAAADAFGAPTQIASTPPASFQNGDFFEDGGGNLHAVFNRGGIVHRVSRDGASWDPLEELEDPGDDLAQVTALRVGAAPDGGGGVVLLGDRDGEPPGVLLLPFGPVGSGSDVDCPPTARVGEVVVRAQEGCLKKDGSRYTTGSAVTVNGVEVEPAESGVYRLTLDTKDRTLETHGSASVRVGGVQLDRGALAWKLPAGEGRLQRIGVADGSVFRDLGKFAKRLFSFPVDGDAELRVATGAAAKILTDFRMPPLLGGVTGSVTLRTADLQGLILDGFRIKVPSARIGKLRVAEVDVLYTGDPDLFTGMAKFQLPPAYGPPFTVGFGLREGELSMAHVDKAFDPTLPIVGVAPQPVVGLDRVAFDYLNEAGSRKFQGQVLLQGGPAIKGLRVSELDGSVTLQFPESDPTTIEANGNLKIVSVPFATGHVLYSTDGLFTFDGAFQFPPEGKWTEIAKVSGTVDGFVALNSPYPFSASGNAAGSIGGIPGGGDAVISTKGITVCVEFPDPPEPLPGLPDLGVSYEWGASYPTPVCNVGTFKLEPPGRARDARSVRQVGIADGLPQAAIEIVGQGGAPRVTLTAPNGEQVTTGSQPSAAGRFIAQEFAERSTTYVSIGEPPGGAYTVQPAPGSPPIQSVSLASGLPDPDVSAEVSGHGRDRTLRFRAKKIAGQRVTFAEQTAGGEYREIGSTEKTHGEIAFAPLHSPERKRQIVALVEQDGVPRARLDATTYTAPKQRPLRSPRRLAIRRRGGKLALGWSEVNRADGYQVSVLLPRDGRRLLRFTGPRARTMTVGGIEPSDSAKVAVAAIGEDAEPGHPRRGKLRPARHRRR